MADKLLMVLLNLDPEAPAALAAAINQATCAASMEYDVEIVLTGRAGRLAARGQAGALPGQGGRSAYELLREAVAAGAILKATGDVTESWGEALIPEVREVVGGAYIISEAMDEGTVVVTY